jgi:hypothetical protein
MSMSIVTDTNSTVSGIPGPGRTLGILLSGGGRRVESAINRTVERLGYSPNAIMQRILALLRVWHVYNCQGPQFAKPSWVAPEFSVLIEEAAILSSELCSTCRCFYFQKIPNVDLDLRITSQLKKLLEFLQHKVISTRCLAAHYLYALVIMDTSICDALLKAEAVQALEAVLNQVATNKWADEEWFTLEAPVRQTLQALQAAAPWFPSVPSSQRDQPHVYFPALVRLSRCVCIDVDHLKVLRLLIYDSKTARSAWLDVLATSVVRTRLLGRGIPRLSSGCASRHPAPEYLLLHNAR